MAKKPCRSLPSSSEDHMPNEPRQLELNRCRDRFRSWRTGFLSCQKPVHRIPPHTTGESTGHGNYGHCMLAPTIRLWVQLSPRVLLGFEVTRVPSVTNCFHERAMAFESAL
jgi:hypothetical protein